VLRSSRRENLMPSVGCVETKTTNLDETHPGKEGPVDVPVKADVSSKQVLPFRSVTIQIAKRMQEGCFSHFPSCSPPPSCRIKKKNPTYGNNEANDNEEAEKSTGSVPAIHYSPLLSAFTFITDISLPLPHTTTFNLFSRIVRCNIYVRA